MKCKKCGGESIYIIDSRPSANGIRTKRRRECADCGERITTYEVTADEYKLISRSEKILKKAKDLLEKYYTPDSEEDKDDE